jgi:dihydroorotase-like cyclic amidohydrolase
MININDLGQRMAVNTPDELRKILVKYPNTDVGLWQINNKMQSANLAKAGFTIYDMLDPEKATQFAAWLYSKNKWNPWYGADRLGITDRSGGE